MSEAAGKEASQRLVPLGEIVGTHGVGGLVRLRSYSDVESALAALAAPCSVLLQNREVSGAHGGARATVARSRSAAQGEPSTTADADLWRPARILGARRHGRLVLLEI